MRTTVRSAGIVGTGYYVPEKILTNFDLEKMVDTSDEWIVERTGIRERRIAEEGVPTTDIALPAARAALADAGIGAEELDLIIFATQTPDMTFPSAACVLQHKLDAVNAAAFDLSAACSGFVYGLATATQFVLSGAYRRILVVGAEALSRIIDWGDRNTCVLFGDGAGAAVVGEVEEGYGLLSFDLGADGAGGDHLLLPAGGSLHPASEETLEKRLHYVHMNGGEVFKFATKVMSASALRSLKKIGMESKDVDLVVPHQANIRIIQSAAKRLKMPMDKIMINVEKYGNTSAASIPIALAEAVQAGRIVKGKNVLLVGFGAGLTWASCVMKWAK